MPIIPYNQTTLFHDAKRFFSGLENIENPEVAEPHIAKIMEKHIGINIKSNRLQLTREGLQPKDFEAIKTNCLITIQMAYLNECNERECANRTPITTNNSDNEQHTGENDRTGENDSTGGYVQLSKEEINAISQQFSTQFKRAFWDKIEKDLDKNPPETKHLLVLFREIRDRLDKMTPNRTDLIAMNHENIDLNYIQSQFNRPDKKQIDATLLVGLVHFVAEDRLQQFLAPVHNNAFKMWWDKIKVELNNNGSSESIGVTIVRVLEGLYEWIECVESDLEQFHNQVKMAV